MRDGSSDRRPALDRLDVDAGTELSLYALSGQTRRLLWAGLVVGLAATVALAVCDPAFGIRLTIPALLCMSVANLGAAPLLFARRLLPVREAFRIRYKSGRTDERRSFVGDF